MHAVKLGYSHKAQHFTENVWSKNIHEWYYIGEEEILVKKSDEYLKRVETSFARNDKRSSRCEVSGPMKQGLHIIPSRIMTHPFTAR